MGRFWRHAIGADPTTETWKDEEWSAILAQQQLAGLVGRADRHTARLTEYRFRIEELERVAGRMQERRMVAHGRIAELERQVHALRQRCDGIGTEGARAYRRIDELERTTLRFAENKDIDLSNSYLVEKIDRALAMEDLRAVERQLRDQTDEARAFRENL